MACGKESTGADAGACKGANPPSSQNNQDKTDDPVNVVTGAFTLTETDLTFPTQRLVISLTRYYDSSLHSACEAPGPFGCGWTHSLNMHIEPGPGSGQCTFVDDHGVRIIFTPDSLGQFSPPPGSLGLRLEIVATGYSLRQVDGLTAEFQSDGKISALVRPGPSADSRITFTYEKFGRLDKVTGVGQRELSFYYMDESPLIRVVHDHTGREWRYFYDSDHDLVRVIDPTNREREYQYVHQSLNVTIQKDQNAPIAVKESIEPRLIRAMVKVFQHHRYDDTRTLIPEATNIYTSDGRVQTQIDALGNRSLFNYNRFTRITEVTDPAGWTTLYAYDKAGNTTKVRHPEGGTYEYIFDSQRNLLAEIDPLGNRTEYVRLKDSSWFDRQQEYGHRPTGNRSDYLDIQPELIELGYDSNGNRPLVRNAIGDVTRFEAYSDFGQPGHITLPNGEEIRFQFDERSGLPLRMERNPVASAGNHDHLIRTWEYDAWGNIVRLIESPQTTPEGSEVRSVVEQTFDDLGQYPLTRRTWIDDGDSSNCFPTEENYEWDHLGRLIVRRVFRRRSPDSVAEVLVTRYGYDRLGRPIWEIGPDGTAACVKLDLAGRTSESFLVEKAEPRLLSNVPMNLRLMRQCWYYDATGNIVRHIDPAGATTQYKWDPCRLCTSVTEPTGFSTTYKYDRDGLEIERTTSSGYGVCNKYDAGKRIIQQTNSDGLALTWAYDPVGQLVRSTKIIDGVSLGTTYRYGDLSQWIEVHYPDGAYERIDRDSRGLLKRRERGPKPTSVEVYNRDGLGRLLEVRAGTASLLNTQFTYRYVDRLHKIETRDALGNLCQEQYDSQGNLIRKTDAEYRTVDMRYDSRDHLIKRSSPDGSVDANFSYDFAGHLKSAIEGEIHYHWEHDAAGRVTRHDQTLSKQTRSVVYAFDTSGRLVDKRVDDEWWMKYDYIPNTSFISRVELSGSRLTIRTDTQGRVTERCWHDGSRTHYRYTSDGMVSELKSQNPQGHTIYAQELTYDDSRRPASEVRHYLAETKNYNYTYDSLDRLERVGRTGLAGSSDFRRYEYDALGNRLVEVRDGAKYRTCQYDAANRPVKSQYTDGTVEQYEHDRCGNLVRFGALCFDFDAGERLRQVRSDDSANPLATYTYAGTGERAIITRPQGDECDIYDGLELVISESTIGNHRWFWGFGPDELVGQASPDKNVEPVWTDTYGSVVRVGDSTLMEYDPFGQSLSEGVLSAFGFSGKRWDPESNLYYNRARQYDPNLGRFIQADPVGVDDGPNVYHFARNNPLTYIDLLGLKSSKNGQGNISRDNPKIDLEHLFHGQINSRGMGMGFHHQTYGSTLFARAMEITQERDNNGVYEAKIQVRDTKTDVWQDKDTNKGRSTFFPDHWSRQQVVDEIRSAYQNRSTGDDDVFRGLSNSGVVIMGYVNPETNIMTTVYPVMK